MKNISIRTTGILEKDDEKKKHLDYWHSTVVERRNVMKKKRVHAKHVKP
jgi:hypothetical protein